MYYIRLANKHHTKLFYITFLLNNNDYIFLRRASLDGQHISFCTPTAHLEVEGPFYSLELKSLIKCLIDALGE